MRVVLRKTATLILVFMLVLGWEYSVPFLPSLPLPVARAAISAVTARGSSSSNANGTTLAVSPTANITTGKIAVVAAVSDNNQTTDGASTFHTITDTDGHTWTKVYEVTETDGAVDDGSTVSLWWTKVRTQIDTADSITLTIGASKTDKVVAVFEFTIAAGNTVATTMTSVSTSTTGTSLADTESGLTSREYLFVGVLGAEGEDTTKAPDGSHTEQFDVVSSTSGLAAVNVQLHVATRILTGTSDTFTSTTDFTSGVASVAAFYEVTPTYAMSSYRFYNNADSTDVGSTLALEDTAATLGSTGDAFRLRVALHVAGGLLGISGENFKLQFAQQSGSCDTAYSGESYADVTGATVIAYNNNATPADGDNLTSNANDPSDGHTVVNQDYEEANNFTNSVAAIQAGEDGLWDFSLIDNGASASTAYCLRVVLSDGTAIATPTFVPQITMAASNALPTASGISIDSGAASVTLTENTTKNVVCAGTVTDTNGFSDITAVGAFLFRTTIGTSTASDDNNLYRLHGDSQCVPSGGSGNSETYTCTFAVQYFADPTDAGSPNASDNWTCEMWPRDATATGTPALDTVEMASLMALDVTSAINYGSVNANSDTGATNQTTTVTNTGNRDMDPELSGTAMTDGGSGSIAASQQKYSNIGFTYSGGGTALSGTPTQINITLPQRTGSAVTDDIFWGLGVPNGTPNGSFNGTNTFTAAAGL